MKIAGRKNDGAWFRTNEAIQKLNAQEKSNLAALIAEEGTIAGAHTAMESLITETGLADIPHAATPLEWAQSFVSQGIPRQVWYGVLSWSTYTEQNGLFGKKYVKNYDKPMRLFATKLRTLCKRYFLARRQVRDIFNSGNRAAGNPSGIPDGLKNT